MNLFMRSVSILASAAMISLVPSFSFAEPDTGSADEANTFNVTNTSQGDAGTPNNCDAEDVTRTASEKQYCAKKVAEAEAKKKARENAQQNPPQQGQQQQPQQQQQQQEQPQQASKSSGGANCADTSSDPKGVQAKNTTPLQGATDKGQADALGNGKDSACQQINRSFDQRARQAYQTGEQGGKGLSGTNFPSLEKAFSEYAKNREDCLNNQADAGNQCLEGLSPNTGEAAAGVNNVLGQVGQNASDTCGKFSKAMDLAKAGLSAFNGQCGAAQGSCSSSCSKATSGLKDLQKKAEASMKYANCDQVKKDPAKLSECQQILSQYTQALSEGLEAAKQETDSSDAESVAGKQKICDKKYTANMAGALQGIMGMLAGLQQGAKCEEETNGTAEQKGTLTDKCMAPENAALPECICKANPRTVGCAGAYQSMSSNGAGAFGGGMSDKANVDPNANSGTLDNNGLGGMEQSARSPSGDSPGAPAGGGGAGIGSSTVGSGNGANGGEGEGGKGLNANILGGTGGGGNGGAWGAGGAGDKYRQYLPGGAKDPAKALAGQQAWKNEVTGQGGKSNWEKVKDRYRDNKNTLLNQN